MEEEVNISQIMIDAINSIFNTIFSSIDSSIYSILDDITFISPRILDSPHFHSIFGESSHNGILLIANSLIFGFLLYYGIRLLLSHLLITQTERPMSFIFKLIFFTICMNGSFFICERILFFNSVLSSFIQEIGQNLFGYSISFSNLLTKINFMITIEETNFNLFSIDGLLKSFLSIGFINLTFSYSIRYIMVQVFIYLSPFAFLSLCSSNTSYFFKSWLKCLLSLLFIQILVSLILLILFSIDFSSSNILSKFLVCGSIFSLLKANSYVREFLGGISTDVTSNISSVLKSQ